MLGIRLTLGAALTALPALHVGVHRPVNRRRGAYQKEVYVDMSTCVCIGWGLGKFPLRASFTLSAGRPREQRVEVRVSNSPRAAGWRVAHDDRAHKERFGRRDRSGPLRALRIRGSTIGEHVRASAQLGSRCPGLWQYLLRHRVRNDQLTRAMSFLLDISMPRVRPLRLRTASGVLLP